MELPAEALKQLGVSSILAILVVYLLYWIKQLVTDLQSNYRANTEATVKQNETNIKLKEVLDQVNRKFDDFLRSKGI